MILNIIAVLGCLWLLSFILYIAWNLRELIFMILFWGFSITFIGWCIDRVRTLI